jgi:hypothetical protein
MRIALEAGRLTAGTGSLNVVEPCRRALTEHRDQNAEDGFGGLDLVSRES